MEFTEFTALVEACPDGVVLVEGRRKIPAAEAAHATALARMLARRFPALRFRSGNADGSDNAFSQGVAEVDPTRLQVVAPYPKHKRGSRHAGGKYESPASLTEAQEAEVACKTVLASPQNKGLIERRGYGGPIAAKAAYLLRDTMKAVGHSADFPKPICALFYVDLKEPEAGGTGHTIRVCQKEGIPVVFQDKWRHWNEGLS